MESSAVGWQRREPAGRADRGKRSLARRVLVTGGGGFIGGHLVTYLKQLGYWVRAVDVKVPEFGGSDADEFRLLDLRDFTDALDACDGVTEVFALAADMGGLGHLVGNDAVITHDNLLISLNTIEAARMQEVERYLEASSACVYNEARQRDPANPGLAEDDAYPAMPDMGYGWAKLMAERLCLYYSEAYGMETRIPRLHNVYGPSGTWRGGREKAPAALCRKVAEAADGTRIEVWGDGRATRSFCYVTDAVEGLERLMRSTYSQPINIGRDDLISVDELARLIIDISGKHLSIVHVPGPVGVSGRNSDNTLVRQVLGWDPSIELSAGLTVTYRWIDAQVRKAIQAAAS